MKPVYKLLKRAYWRVLDPYMKEIARFPYPQEETARAFAEFCTEQNRELHVAQLTKEELPANEVRGI